MSILDLFDSNLEPVLYMYNMHCTLLRVQCPAYNLHCALLILHCSEVIQFAAAHYLAPNFSFSWFSQTAGFLLDNIPFRLIVGKRLVGLVFILFSLPFKLTLGTFYIKYLNSSINYIWFSCVMNAHNLHHQYDHIRHNFLHIYPQSYTNCFW